MEEGVSGGERDEWDRVGRNGGDCILWERERRVGVDISWRYGSKRDAGRM